MMHGSKLASWLNGDSQALIVDNKSLSELTTVLFDEVQPSDWILLEGDLGAGKTTFVSSLLSHFSKGSVFTSPTFSLLNVHEFPSASIIKRACHLDLYRIRSDEELIHIGLELQVNEASLVLIEWSENVSPDGWSSFFNVTYCRRPKRIIRISIEHLEQPSIRRYTFDWLRYDELVGQIHS